MRLSIRATLFATLLSFAASLGSLASAQSYITNGEFQTGKLAPWTIVGEASLVGHKIDKGFWWLNKPQAGLKFTGLSQRLWLPKHDGLWMLSIETYGGPTACHYFRVSFDNQVLRRDCVGGDALRQWVLPLAPGAHRVEILATQLGMPEASLVRRANLTKVQIPHAILNQYRATKDEISVFARPWHAFYVCISRRRLATSVRIPGIDGPFWLAPEAGLLTVGPFLSPATGISTISIGPGAIQAARGVFLQVLSIDPQTWRARLGTRNWIPE